MTAELRALSPVLIANRGEIAIRVARTVGELGLRSATVFTPADSRSLHVEAADLALEIASYLSVDDVLGAAERAGARSVHPGYGFLSENAGFARAVEEAGLGWIGPPPAAIELMGDKGRSKQLAREAGVPVIPGTAGLDAELAEIADFGAEHGYPILIKAVAGGGGKGMRVVAAEAELEVALEAARREARAAFGDKRVLAERYLDRPRHIEIQVLGDSHGGYVHFGERECSLQRRHQKVVEEAPSPAVDERTRAAMGEAALELCRACSYEGVGTVELIAPAGGGEFFFLEMNTRLQVEHPVTELVWGVDLVEQQLRVAAGEPLGLAQGELRPDGHAVEARIYAEDPAAGFLPATGTVRWYREPSGPGVRVDSGVRLGSSVGTEFDPMLAKVIAHGPDRHAAFGRLEGALGSFELLGLNTNIAFSRELIGRADVLAGEQDTGLLERVLGELAVAAPDDLLAAAAAIRRLADVAGLGIEPGPWRRGFHGLGEVAIDGDRLRIADGTDSTERSWQFDARELDAGHALVSLDGLARVYAFARDGETIWVARDGHQLEARPERRARSGAGIGPGSLEAPMPGTVLAVRTTNGEAVEEGQVLIVLESMKMELQVTAPHAGTVGGLELSEGDRVEPRQTLLAVTPLSSDSTEGPEGPEGEREGEDG